LNPALFQERSEVVYDTQSIAIERVEWTIVHLV